MSGVTPVGGSWVLTSLNVVPEFRVDEGRVIVRLTGCVEEPIVKVMCHTIAIELTVKTKPEEVIMSCSRRWILRLRLPEYSRTYTGSCSTLVRASLVLSADFTAA